jgi:hypothetical protein
MGGGLKDKGILCAAFMIWLSGKSPATADNDAWSVVFTTKRLSVSNLRNVISGNVNKGLLLMLQGVILHNPDMVTRGPESGELF